MTSLCQYLSYVTTSMLWFFTVMTLLGGCSAKKLPPYPVQAASSYPYFQVKDGLAIGITPLTDPQESEKYFDADLLSRGILAIFVSAENQGSPGTFLLLKGWFILQTALREEHQVSSREQPGSSSLAATHTVMSGLAVIGYPKSTDKTVKSTVSINKHGLFRDSSFSPMDERGIVRKSA